MGIATIRRLYDFINPINIEATEQAKKILLSQFEYLNHEEADEIFK